MSKRRRNRSSSLSGEDTRGDAEKSEVDTQLAEAGPSRLQYPPRAQLSSRNDDRPVLRLSHSSSSLFWNSTNDPTLPAEDSTGKEKKAAPRPRRRRSSVSFVEAKDSIEGRRAGAAASITSTKSSNGGWVDWLTGRSNRAAERAEAGIRLGKKLKRAEARSRLKKQMASRDTRISTNSFDLDSDSDVVITRGDDIIRPEIDVPPPNDTTANALSRVASRVKQNRAPRLHFAPEERKIRKKDLPLDYEQGELYRGLDEFVQASRERRRRIRKRERRRGSRSSRASRSSHSKSSVSSGGSSSSSSSSDDSDDGSSSTGSSSSSASGRLTMARLRAFFGDSSSDSSTSSSSSDDDSSSTSSTRSDRHASRDNLSNSSDDTRSTTSKATFRLFRRRKANKTNVDSEEDGSPPPTPRIPRTPALTFQIKGGAERRRKRRAAQRYRAQEKRLIEEGKIPPKPSRKARKKAKMARLQAGGITEYTLFTPVALGDLGETHHTRPSLGGHAFTMQRVDTIENKAIKEAPPERVLNTVSFAAVKERLHALRRHRRQIDNAGGDLGLSRQDPKKTEKNITRRSQEVAASSKVKEISVQDNEDGSDFDEGDLSLPPPALDLPEMELGTDDVSSTERRRRRRQTTEWHMSDVPLTPHIQMATDFARGFEVGAELRRAPFNPSLATQHERTVDQSTPPSDHPSSSENNASNKMPSGISSTTALDSPRETAHAAWWLDINCPTYRDMTELSKMFPLHPLTVEDILQQDTREKVEVFEKLNYYFVVVRAIDEKYFKFTPSPSGRSETTIVGVDKVAMSTEKQDANSKEELEMKEMRPDAPRDANLPGRVDIVERLDEKEGLEGVSVGAINLYLIVFSHGVISFHFEDISKHTDHVRRRLLDLTQPVELTSDWIAHGIFDSIVDAFSPLLTFVQTEVEDIERLADEPLPRNKKEAALARRNKLIGMEKKMCKKHDKALPVWVIHEKRQRDVLRFASFVPISPALTSILPPFILTKKDFIIKEKVSDDSSPPRTGLQRMFGLGKHRAHRLTTFQSNSAQEQKVMLRRITETRKIVTGLSRLLTPKNDSVRGLRKRLVDLRSPSMSTTEMSIYMGDVHDHIVTMLSLLASDDHRLSDTHLSYLSVIRMTNSLTSHSKDEVLVFLATITITIVATIFLCSMFSLNVHVPMNIHFSSTYHWFGGVVAGAGVIPFLSILRTYTWIKQAKAKSAARQAIR